MVMGVTDQERRRITQIADEYRRRGYSVIVEPPPNEVPAFIKPYRPDLIAKGPLETVVVEVKAGTQSRPDLVSVASAINGRPGWRFELVLIARETEPVRTELVDVEELEKGLPEAERLMDAGLLGPAFVVLWAITEGALRHAARRRGLAEEPDSRRLVRQLTSFGAITQNDLQLLERSMSIRNRVAHGYQPGMLDEGLVGQLRDFTRRLLEAGETVDDSFDFQTVSTWVNAALKSFRGYRLHDAVFDRDAVIVRALDGTEFLVTMEAWTDMDSTERLDQLRMALNRWAQEHLPPEPLAQ